MNNHLLVFSAHEDKFSRRHSASLSTASNHFIADVPLKTKTIVYHTQRVGYCVHLCTSSTVSFPQNSYTYTSFGDVPPRNKTPAYLIQRVPYFVDRCISSTVSYPQSSHKHASFGDVPPRSKTVVDHTHRVVHSIDCTGQISVSLPPPPFQRRAEYMHLWGYHGRRELICSISTALLHLVQQHRTTKRSPEHCIATSLTTTTGLFSNQSTLMLWRILSRSANATRFRLKHRMNSCYLDWYHNISALTARHLTTWSSWEQCLRRQTTAST